MKRILFVAMIAAWSMTSVIAQEAVTESLSDRVNAIGKEFSEARTEFSTKYRAASEEERKVLLENRPTAEPYIARLWELVDPDPKADGVGDALAWILRYGRQSETQSKAGRLMLEHHPDHEGVEASIMALSQIEDEVIQKGVAQVFARKWKSIDEAPESDDSRAGLLWMVYAGREDEEKAKAGRLLFAHHAAHTDVTNMIPTLARIDDEDVREGIREVAENGPTKEARGQALHALADGMLRARNLKGGKSGDANETEICELLTRVAEEYGDVKSRRGTLGDAAEKALADIKTRGIGRPALDIEAEDTDGVNFKLSDYRGKAVLLDFWGHW